MHRRKRKKSGSSPSSDNAVRVIQILFVVLAVALAGGLAWLLTTFRWRL